MPSTTDAIGHHITGRTRLYAIVGDPIAQVKTPQAINQILAQRGLDGVLMPLHVAPPAFANLVTALRGIKNFGGMVVTVPHKTAMAALCDAISPAAAAVGAVNVVRREADGRLVGDILDGQGFCAGLRQHGIAVEGQSAYLAGAGGAAHAIAFALADAGVARLTIYNRSAARAEAMIARLATYRPDLKVRLGTANPAGHDLVINATSLGMAAGDALSFRADELTADQLVAEIIMQPALTPLLAAARARGCRIHFGAPMLACQVGLMADFMGILNETKT